MLVFKRYNNFLTYKNVNSSVIQRQNITIYKGNHEKFCWRVALYEALLLRDVPSLIVDSKTVLIVIF